LAGSLLENALTLVSEQLDRLLEGVRKLGIYGLYGNRRRGDRVRLDRRENIGRRSCCGISPSSWRTASTNSAGKRGGFSDGDSRLAFCAEGSQLG